MIPLLVIAPPRCWARGGPHDPAIRPFPAQLAVPPRQAAEAQA